ncbi:MAG: peptidase S9 [Bacteroidetes bacterium SW_9_63_38]|nr:MAG: peptidase S9 [Bacteroidetes bacterium SW_9_63_38]
MVYVLSHGSVSRHIGWLLLVSVLAAVPASAQEQTGPSVDYEGDLPPLIDRQTFFGDPQYAGAQLSPTGEYVSFTKPYKGRMNVWVKKRGAPFEAAEPVTADTTRPVSRYFWTQDGERILYVQDKGGNENFHVYAVDPESKKKTDLGVPPAEDLTPYEDVRAQIIAVPEARPGDILVGLNDRTPKYHDVYRIDLATGERTLLYKNDQRIAGWTTDREGTLRLATRQTESGGTELLRVEDDTLVSVYACSFEETCRPVRFHKNGERVYMTTNKGSDVDRQRLVLFNPEAQATEVVEADPEGEVDFGGAIFSDNTDELLATVYEGDRTRIYPKAEAFADDYQFLQEQLDGEVSFGSSTEDERYRIVTASSDVNPGTTYLFDRQQQSLTKLYESRPDLPSEHLAEMRAIRYEARDDRSIPAYLTLPTGVTHKDLPTIVLPHGGPWARDSWGYAPYAQFFANRGYAVLQPNFRGSTGYGQQFLNAGNEEWGTGAMQHDLTDGVRHLVDDGIADSSRAGIFGGSYGGYATLAGLTFTPEVYAAGASYVGPSNLLTLLTSIPPYWATFKKRLNERVGDPDDPQDRKRLKRQSPFFHADQIDDPLLVIQGANDPRVKKQESDQIVVAARGNDVPTQYLVAPEEGHGFEKEDNRLAVAAQLERFFGEHLGGRWQTDVAPAVQARLDALRRDVGAVTLPDTTQADAATVADGVAALDGSVLSPITLNYKTTLEAGQRTMNRPTRRTLASAMHDGRDTWRIIDAVEGAAQADTLVVDRNTLRPIERRVGGRGTVRLTFDSLRVTGQLAMRGQTRTVQQEFDRPVLASTANLEMGLATLPLDPRYEASVPVFQLQQQTVATTMVRVTGTETVEVPAGRFETYVLEATSKGAAPSGTIYVRKNAPHHVVKADLQVTSGGRTISATKRLTKMRTETTPVK